MLSLHTPEALAGLGQTFPHVPQLVASVETIISQPSPPFRLQSRRFVPHEPFVQVVEPFVELH